MVAAMKPPTMPGARPGRSAIANAMNPDRIGTRKLNEAAPTRNKSAAQCIPSAGLKSVTMLTMCVGLGVGGPVSEYSFVTTMAPFLPPASWATMKPSAMRMPPAATNGIM